MQKKLRQVHQQKQQYEHPPTRSVGETYFIPDSHHSSTYQGSNYSSRKSEINAEPKRWNNGKSSTYAGFIDQQNDYSNYYRSPQTHLIQVPPQSKNNFEPKYQSNGHHPQAQDKQFYSSQRIRENILSKASNINQDMHQTTGKSLHRSQQCSKYQNESSSFGHHGREQFSTQATSHQNYTNYQIESEEAFYEKWYSNKFEKQIREPYEREEYEVTYRYLNQHVSRIPDSYRENHHSFSGIRKSNHLQPIYHNEDGEQVVIPQRQPLIICQEALEEIAALQREFYRMAEQGNLLIELQDFLSVLCESEENSLQGLYESDFEELLDIAENAGIIHTTKRNFAKMKTLCFVSLQLDVLSLECISWVLKSLKNDEMSPTERAIQSRIKEAFAFKIGNELWQLFVNQIDKGVGQRAPHKNQGSSKPLRLQFFQKEIIEDPTTGQMAKAIYPKEEEWIGVDQSLEPIDQALFKRLKEFLEEYFCSKGDEDSLPVDDIKWCSSLENGLTRVTQQQNSQKFHHIYVNPSQDIDLEEVRAIPGGRYGCAQFIKICGPQELKTCSLGRLAQFVQHAVKEDVLRYHKTLLIWTAAVDKHKKQTTPNTSSLSSQLSDTSENKHKPNIERKLNYVKQALLEILQENNEGMSLAQLPLYLRRKLSFPLDLNELGFPKLKDLIISMSDKIQLEHRGHNHPFATLIKNGCGTRTVFNKDEQQIVVLNNHQHKLEQNNIKAIQVTTSSSKVNVIGESRHHNGINQSNDEMNVNDSTLLSFQENQTSFDQGENPSSHQKEKNQKEEMSSAIEKESGTTQIAQNPQDYENQTTLPIVNQDSSLNEHDITNLQTSPKVVDSKVNQIHQAQTSKFCYSQTLRNANKNHQLQMASSAKHRSDAFDLDSFTNSLQHVKRNDNCSGQFQQAKKEDCNAPIANNTLETNHFTNVAQQNKNFQQSGKNSPSSNQIFFNNALGENNYQIQASATEARQIQPINSQIANQYFNPYTKNGGVQSTQQLQSPFISSFIQPQQHSNVSIHYSCTYQPHLGQSSLSQVSQYLSSGAVSQNSKGSSATSVQPFEKSESHNQFYQPSSSFEDTTGEVNEAQENVSSLNCKDCEGPEQDLNIKFIEQLVCDDDFEQGEEKESHPEAPHCQRVVSIQYQDSTSPCVRLQSSFGSSQQVYQQVNEKNSSLLSLPETSANLSGYVQCSHNSEFLEKHFKLTNKKANSGGPQNDCFGNFQLLSQNCGPFSTQVNRFAYCNQSQRGSAQQYFENNNHFSVHTNLSTSSGFVIGSQPQHESYQLQSQRQTPMYFQNPQVSNFQQTYSQQQYYVQQSQQPQAALSFQTYVPPPPYCNSLPVYQQQFNNSGSFPTGMYQPAPYGAPPYQYGSQQSNQYAQQLQQPFGNNIHQQYY